MKKIHKESVWLIALFIAVLVISISECNSSGDDDAMITPTAVEKTV